MTGNRERSNVSGAPTDLAVMPRVRSGSDSGIAPETLSDPAWRGSGRPGGGTHPPLPPR